VYFLGREDSQVKSRGHRIELGEVEAAVNALAEVREAAVVGVAANAFEGTAICCAYASGDGELPAARVRESLRQALPAYMLPSRWLVLPELPKNANGKIDRRSLPEPTRERLAKTPSLEATSETERELVAIWRDVARDLALVALMYAVVHEIRHPDDDDVRRTYGADPAGGVLVPAMTAP
jgi:hypothetical protein